MKTILITNDQLIAKDAQSAGVSRIMVDLELIGKKERQASRTTFISNHQPQDIEKIRAVLTDSQLIVRINSYNKNSGNEIEHAITAGADIIMLPMITDIAQLDKISDLIAGRAMLLPLVETAYSMAHITYIAAHPAVSEVYIGLNDLHLSLGLDYLFEPLSLGLLDWMADKIKATDKSFGFGGIATIGSGELPAEFILAEHVRLNSTCIILSSRFTKDINIYNQEGRVERIKEALLQMENKEIELLKREAEQVEEDRKRTAIIISKIAQACIIVI
jgi:hypothetical protein